MKICRGELRFISLIERFSCHQRWLASRVSAKFHWWPTSIVSALGLPLADSGGSWLARCLHHSLVLWLYIYIYVCVCIYMYTHIICVCVCMYIYTYTILYSINYSIYYSLLLYKQSQGPTWIFQCRLTSQNQWFMLSSYFTCCLRLLFIYKFSRH